MAGAIRKRPGSPRRTLFARWPERVTQAVFVSTLRHALDARARHVAVVVPGLRADARRRLLELSAMGFRVVAVSLTKGAGGLRARLVDLKKEEEADPALARRKARIAFWEAVATEVERGSVSRTKKGNALGRSSHGIVYAMGRPGWQMAVLHDVWAHRLCVEYRIQGIEYDLCKNQYGQLKRHMDVEAELGGRFDVRLGGEAVFPKRYYVRLTWRKPFRDTGLDAPPEVIRAFAADVLFAQRKLAEVVPKIVEYYF